MWRFGPLGRGRQHPAAAQRRRFDLIVQPPGHPDRRQHGSHSRVNSIAFPSAARASATPNSFWIGLFT